jgi:hypothetical protein
MVAEADGGSRRAPAVLDSSLDVPVPPGPAGRLLLATPPWIVATATVAVHEAVAQAAMRHDTPEYREALGQIDDWFHCTADEAVAVAGAVVIPLLWTSELEARLFPPAIDATLRAEASGSRDTRLSVRALYGSDTSRRGAGTPDWIVEAAFDAYLIAVASTLHHLGPSGPIGIEG